MRTLKTIGGRHMPIGSALFDASLRGENDTTNTLNSRGSAIALGGGVFITAAHTLNELHVHDPSNSLDPATDTYDYVSGYIPLVNDSIVGNVHIDSKYSSSVSSPKESPNVANHDSAYFITSPDVTVGSTAPMVVFADQAAAQSFLTSGLPINFSGAVTSTSGLVQGVTTGAGQFTAQYNSPTQAGDSGGAVATNIGGTSYYIGLHNAGSKDIGLETYFNTSLYDSAVKHIPLGDPVTTNLTPDLIYGSQKGEVVKSSKRRASVITNGDSDTVALGSGSGIISTGIGAQDIVVLNDASVDGSTGLQGDTVVISPGSKTIIGGSTADKLVLLTDRLSDPTATTISDTPDTVSLVGGAYLASVGNGDSVEKGSLTAASSLDSAKGGTAYGDFVTNGDPSTGGSVDSQTGSVEVNPSNIAVFDNGTYSANYTLVQGQGQGSSSDLYIDVTSSSGNWESKIVVEGFQDGDYGLTFMAEGTNHGIYQDGFPLLQDYFDDQQTYLSQNDPSPVSGTQVNDAPTVSWDGQNSANYYAASQSEVTQAKSALASDDFDTSSQVASTSTTSGSTTLALYRDQSAGQSREFVFATGLGASVLNSFNVRGAHHDTLDLAGVDFGNSIADVLRHAVNSTDGVVITDPTTGDTMQLKGVYKAQLIYNRADLSFQS